MHARTRAVGTLGMALILGSAALTGCGPKADTTAKQKPGIGDPGGTIPVQVATVKLGTIEQTVPVTGSIQALQDVQVSAKTSARVTAVNFREGDRVRAGQVLATQDSTDLKANVLQDQAAIASARQQVSSAQQQVASAQQQVVQAYDNYRIQVSQADEAVRKDQAVVAGAEQNYLKVKGGSRPQQKLQSQASVEQAQANVDNALTTLNRNKSLYAQGAIARSELDTSQTTYNVNVQQLNNAKAALSLTLAGNQPEDIAYALQQVNQQKATLASDIANRRQVAVRRSAIAAAQASVRQTQASVRGAEATVRQQQAKLLFDTQQINNVILRSPIDGIVAAREVEPGQVASPGTNLIRVVNLKTVYYEPTISEAAFAQAQVGNAVQVQADALTGKTYSGKVAAIYPAASASGRVFSMRVTISNPNNELRPGMFARGSLVTKIARNVPLVPTTAIVPAASAQGFESNTSSNASITTSDAAAPQQVIVLGSGNQAVVRRVQIGISTMTETQIKQGVSPGEQIVTVGQQGLKNGDKLAVQNGSGGGNDRNKKTAQAGP